MNSPEIQFGHTSEVPAQEPQDLVFEETPVPTPEPVVESVVEPQKVSHATQRDPVEIQPTKPLSKLTYKVSLPSFQLGTFTSLLKQAGSANPDAIDTDSDKVWRDVSDEMVSYYTPASLYQDRLEKEGSDFQQGLVLPDNSLQQFTAPKFKKTDGELKGELALLKVSRALGQGEVLTIPLPHSGINVTIKPPGERAVIDFYNSVFREKISIGRMTAGLTLTNFSVHINNRLFDFIVDHIHSINYSDISKTELRKYVKLADFYTLATGLASAMNPNGFEFRRPCISPDGKCNYVAEGLINLSKLYWVDNSALSEIQKQLLAESRPGRLTLDQYKKYQSDHTSTAKNQFTVTTGESTMTFYLRSPSFEEYVTDGMDWVNHINNAVDSVIVTEGDEEEIRSQMLQQYIKSSTLRQFSHFFDYMEIDGEPISDRASLNKVLELLSADDLVREEIFKEVFKYKSESVISVIGIPEYKCPNCHAEQNTEPVNQGLVSVIPLDVMNLFFTLLTLRMSRILER